MYCVAVVTITAVWTVPVKFCKIVQESLILLQVARCLLSFHQYIMTIIVLVLYTFVVLRIIIYTEYSPSPSPLFSLASIKNLCRFLSIADSDFG